MKKIFYSLIGLALLTACSNDDMMPDVPKEGPVQLASVSVGTHTRGTLIDNNFVFGSGDQVMMTAMVDGSVIRNTFTYDGNKWTQDTPTGRYSTIYWQDNPAIRTIVSYGGKPVPPTTGMFLNQNSEGKYIAADRMEADPGRRIGSISNTDDFVSAELGHASADFVVKVRDGEGSANVLAEGTPVLTVTIDADGLDKGGETYDYIAWNTGKSQDENGDWYTTFRVILPAGCTIIKATLSKANASAGNATTEIKFYWAESHEPSVREELKHGTRYSATYEYHEYLSMTSVGISIKPFDEYAEQDITASKDWSFDETTKTYTVFTAEGLQIVNQDIAKNIATKGDYNITLAADITLPEPTEEGGRNWRPLSINSRYPYNGTFDGAGHTITNLVVRYEYANYISLIGYAGVESVVKNVTLANPVMQADFDEVGGIAGHSSGVISNCHIRGGNFNAGFSVSIGGICGMFDGSEITGCTVSGFTINGFTELGGICGRVENSKINSCIVSGVTIKEENEGGGYTFCVGGIVGYTKESTVTANISENNTLEGKDHIGAIYGYTEGTNTIEANTVTTCTLNGNPVDGTNN